MRDLYCKQWYPAGKPERVSHPEQFLSAVTAELDVARGDIEEANGMLVSQPRRLWPEAV